jgi:hypothetical protein
MALGRKDLGEVLLESDLVNEAQLAAAMSERARWQNYLPRALLELKLVPERKLCEVIGRHFGLPVVELGTRSVPPAAYAVLDREFCRQRECAPIAYDEKSRQLDVAVFDPSRDYDAIRFRSKCNVRQHVAPLSAILAMLDRQGAEPEAPKVTRFSLAGLEAEGQASPPPAAAAPAVPDGIAELRREVAGLKSAQEELRREVAGLKSAQEELGRELAELRRRLGERADLTDHRLRDLEVRVKATLPEPSPAASTRAALAVAAPKPPPGPIRQLHSEEIVLPPVEEEHDDDGIVIDTAEPSGDVTRAAAEVAAAAVAAVAEEDPGPAAVLIAVPRTERQVVAIDFGTTRSSVGTVVDGRVEVLRLPSGAWDMPSSVAFRRDGTVMLGDAARTAMTVEPAHGIVSPKRVLGRRHGDPLIGSYLQGLAMSSFAGSSGEVMLRACGREITVTEACAHILHLLKLVAERYLGRPVAKALLTTPVSFGEPQYAALQQAAELAELEVEEFVDEPVAAALANTFDPDCHGLVAVYDFGGGTFDFSVCEVNQGELKVVATAGDGWLGGDDLDEQLAVAAANAIWRQHGIDLRKVADQWQRLLIAAEKTKRDLSTSPSAVLELKEVARTASGTLDVSITVSREQFAAMCDEIVRRSIDACSEALSMAGVDRSQLSAVYLSGGTCYVPAVRDAVRRFFGREPRAAVPPERAVLVGAVLSGAGIGG